MSYTDEELQNKFDRQKFSGEGIDAESYRSVFDALKQEPHYSLPLNFADKMVDLVEAKENQKQSSRDTFWFAFGLALFVVGSGVAVYLTNFKLSVGVFKFASGYQGLLIFAITFVLLLNWVDSKLIRKIKAF